MVLAVLVGTGSAIAAVGADGTAQPTRCVQPSAGSGWQVGAARLDDPCTTAVREAGRSWR